MKPIDLYKKLKTDSPEVNRLRNILAGWINLRTQYGNPYEFKWSEIIDFIEKEILRLRAKRGRKINSR